MSQWIHQFHFLRPLWLLMLIPTVIVWWKLYRGMDPRLGLADDIAPHLLEKLVTSPADRPRVRPVTMILPLALLGSLSLAGPSFRMQPSPFAEDKSQLLLVVKITPSMLNDDLQPSRLERVRTKLHDLMELRTGADTGLIAYSGSAHLVMPATSDSGVIDHMLESLEPEVMPIEGDSLADALQIADRQLSGQSKPGSILVVADSVEEREVSAVRDRLQDDAPQVQFLVPLRDQSALDRSGVEAAAKALKNSPTQRLTSDDQDIRVIANRADRAIVGYLSDESLRWRDDGYLFVPILVLGVLLWSRRGWTMEA